MRIWMVLSVIALFWLSACGSGLAGTYEDETGITTYEFQRNGRVYISVLGTTVAGEYKIDGDKVLVTSPQGTIVLTRKDKKLIGPMGMELVLQQG